MAAAIPNNLPHQLSSFIGREREIAEVRRLLASSRLVTLTGAGGCGKTRLALEVGAALCKETPSSDVPAAPVYRDGVWFVDLAPLSDAALVPQQIATAVGVREQTGQPVLSTLVAALREKHLLLVLDNCEHLIEACARLAEALLQACARLFILTTSREPLNIAGETTFIVPSLSAPDPRRLPPFETLDDYEAVRLFTERARAVRSAFALTPQNGRSVTDICHQLDGIPLALELAAALVTALSVEQIAARLGNIFSLLTTGRRTALPRHQTLWAALDWSHDLLSEPERVLFRRLSVFAGGWTVEAAEFVCQDVHESLNVFGLLARLIQKSLVLAEAREGETRYRLLEPVREYARLKVVEAGEEKDVRDRHLEFFLTLAEEIEPRHHGSQEVMWMNQLETEHDNFRAALDWSLASDRSVSGLRLAGALREFWDTHAHASEGRRRLAALLAKPEAVEPTIARAVALHAAGYLAFVQRDVVAGRSCLEEALAIANALGDQRLVASVLLNLGNVTYAEGNFADARALYEKSLAIRRELEDNAAIATGLVHVGLVALRDGKYEGAQRLFEESLTHSTGLNDTGKGAYVCLRMGQAALHQGDHQKADSLCHMSLSLSLAMANEPFILAGLALSAALSAARGHTIKAVRLYAAVGALLASKHVQLRPYDDDQYHTNIAAIRTELGAATFAEMWREGGQLTMEQALAEVERGMVDAQTSVTSQPPTLATPTYPFSLTGREVEILRLVAQGLTDPQIAETLVVSPRTVHAHLRSIYNKLNVTTRTAAARVAIEKMLV